MPNQIREPYALLGLFRRDPAQYFALYGKKEEIPAEAIAVAEERKTARAEKNWAKSDELRENIMEIGYAVTDSKKG